MTTTSPEPSMAEEEGPRHRELGRDPGQPAPMRVRDVSRDGLQPEEVPARLDPLGRPVEAVRPTSVEAAAHWSEQLWHRR